MTSKKTTEKSRKRKAKGRNSPREGLDFSLQSSDLSSESSKGPKRVHGKAHGKDNDKELCENCSKDLSRTERALFVEEEVGRIFCSESCIAAFFTPDITRLEKEYFRR
ncbi:MAG: hypothetical protein ABI041_00300, partial [Bdellovibrionia bacterium]